jgi:hypothetical protein
MRKLLILPIILLFASTGCESLRRVEVWKQQTFFAPSAANQPVGPPPMAPTPAMAPMPGIAPAQVPGEIVVQSPVITETPESTEAYLPGPAENIAPGPVETGPSF